MRWGKWTFDRENLCLAHRDEHYEIDLEEVDSSAAMLDWIFQIQSKSWADANTVHDLLRAFSDILDPQVNYCPGEQDRRPNVGKILRAFIDGRSTNHMRPTPRRSS